MVGRNSFSEPTGQEAVPAAGHDQGLLDELRAFRVHVPHTGAPPQVSTLLSIR